MNATKRALSAAPPPGRYVAYVDGVPIRPAATVILVRDGADCVEVLLLRRASTLVFHGGAWVFPGGQIDGADYAGAVAPDDPTDAGYEAAARFAAVREALEEASVVVEPANLVPFAHWVTPAGRPRRFSTWFYLAACDGESIRTDGCEITDHRWIVPADALGLLEAGAIDLPVPTRVSLARLVACVSSADALREARDGEYIRFRPDG